MKRILPRFINSRTLMASIIGLSVVAAVALPERGKANTSLTYAASRCKPTTLIGHRGTAEGGVRNNTLPALKKAVAGGAATLEIDIHVTKSVSKTKKTKAQPAVWVVNHDSTITRKVNGKNVTKTISKTTYNDLKKFAPDLMTYSEALSYAKSTNRNLEVEIKPSSVSASRMQGLSDVLRKTGMQNKVTYSSFKADMLRSYRAVKNRAGKTAFITNTALPTSTASLNSYAAGVRKYADVIVLRYSVATAANVTVLKNNKLVVEVYTTNANNPAIDTGNTWAKYIGYGANGIITDRPGAYTQWCKDIQPKPPIFTPPAPVTPPAPTPEPAEPTPVEPEPADPEPEQPTEPGTNPTEPTEPTEPEQPADPPVSTEPPSAA